MFKKLKDKIAEEVKSSPSRIQQLAQVAQAAVSSASSTTSESIPSTDNFFSITEEDTPRNSPHHGNPPSEIRPSVSPLVNYQHQTTLSPNNGAIPTTRTRKLSNSSMASDVSFRLPTYDAAPPTLYNVQSDLDASASEFEDGASTTGYEAQLDVISKEKLYEAYKKSLERYQKYRSRYTEIVRRYRDLERDNNKARAVLVETQDKALRRIGELREQCSLEQQAKAHLESALRMEMEEQQCIIKTLKTKLSLLGENPEEIVKKEWLGGNNDDGKNSVSNNGVVDDLISIDSDNIEANGSTIDHANLIAGASIMITDSNDKIIALERQIASEREKYAELNRKYEAAQKQMKELIVREEENTILLAQNKMAIHAELENREKEMKSLKTDAAQSASEKECLNEIVTELREENSKANATIKELSEAKRALEQRVEEIKRAATNHESDIKELRAKVIVLDSEKQTIVTKNQLEFEKFKARYDNLLRKNEQLEEISRSKVIESHEKLENELKHLKMAHAEISKLLNEEQTKNAAIERQHQDTLQEQREAMKRMSVDFDSAKADKMKLEGRFKQIFEEKQNLLTEMEATKTQLQQVLDEKENLHNQIVTLTEQNQKLQDALDQEKETTESQKRQVQKEKSDSSTDVVNLKSKIDLLKNEKRDLEKTLEKEIRDKTELQTQVTNILQEIGRLEEQLKEVKESYAVLEHEKLVLERKSAEAKYNQEETDSSESGESELKELQSQIKELEAKLKDIQCENSQLAEKNCLLEESNNRLQVTQRELESAAKTKNQLNKELADQVSALSLELDSAKEENERLQEKLKQSLDDYAELFNTKEQMDQEHRSLLDQIEAKEKEKLCLISSNDILESDLAKLRAELGQQQNLEAEKVRLTTDCDSLHQDLDEVRNQNRILSENKHELEAKVTQLAAIVEEITADKQKLQYELNDALSQKEELQQQSLDLESTLSQWNTTKENLKESLEKLTLLEDRLESHDQTKIENEYLNKSVKLLESDLTSVQASKASLESEIVELREKLKSQQCELYVLTEEHSQRKEAFEKKDQEIEQLKSICQRSQDFTAELQMEIKQQLQQLGALKLINDELQEGKDSISTKFEKTQKEYETLQHTFDEQTKELKTKSEELTAIQQKSSDLKATVETIPEIEQRLSNLQKELDSSRAIIADLNRDLNEQTENLEANQREKSNLTERVNSLETELTALKEARANDDAEILRRTNENLRYELGELKRSHEHEITDLNHQIDELMENAKAYRERQMEMERLRDENKQLTEEIVQIKDRQQSVDVRANENHTSATDEETSDSSNSSGLVDRLSREKIELESKLSKIMNEVQDVSNRNLFLEQKCENYLILEQSNERLKLQNSKLSRQLDETLVSMQHTEDISANTEFEYLRNIMFQYLTNNINSNGSTLIKVIAAVLKFSPQQTQVALEKEAHRKTLLGQINNLLP